MHPGGEGPGVPSTSSSTWLWEQFRSAQLEEQRMRGALLQAEAASLALKEELGVAQASRGD
jgi:hypothetical protein